MSIDPPEVVGSFRVSRGNREQLHRSVGTADRNREWERQQAEATGTTNALHRQPLPKSTVRELQYPFRKDGQSWNRGLAFACLDRANEFDPRVHFLVACREQTRWKKSLLRVRPTVSPPFAQPHRVHGRKNTCPTEWALHLD